MVGRGEEERNKGKEKGLREARGPERLGSGWRGKPGVAEADGGAERGWVGSGRQELAGEAGAEEGGGSTWMSLVGKSAQEETAVDPPCIPQR